MVEDLAVAITDLEREPRQAIVGALSLSLAGVDREEALSVNEMGRGLWVGFKANDYCHSNKCFYQYYSYLQIKLIFRTQNIYIFSPHFLVPIFSF